MSASRPNHGMMAFLPVGAVFLAALCGCSLFVDLESLHNGARPDASTEPQDGAASGGSDGELSPEAAADGATGTSDSGIETGSDGELSPEGAADGAAGTSDSGVESGTAFFDSPNGDGTSLADAPADGTVNPPDAGGQDGGQPCDPARPFGAPTLVGGVQSTAKDGEFRLLPDGLTGFFWSSRAGGPGGNNLYVTTRPNDTVAFGTPVLLNNVNVNGVSEYEPTVTNDGMNLAYRSMRSAGVGGADLYWASRTDVKNDFSGITLLANVNSTSNDVDPFIGGVPNGTSIYYASDRTGDYDLYRATGTAGSYSVPTPISELNLRGGRDDFPVTSSDDLSILFASDRAGGTGSGDIWMASRPNTSSNFSAPKNLTLLNTTGYDRPNWLSADGCKLYLTSDISGNAHIYFAIRM